MRHKTLTLLLTTMLTLIMSGTVYASSPSINGRYAEVYSTFTVTCNKSPLPAPKPDALGKYLIISSGKTQGSHILSFPNPQTCTQGGYCSTEIVNYRATLVPVDIKGAKMTLNNVVVPGYPGQINQTGVLELKGPSYYQACLVQVTYKKL